MDGMQLHVVDGDIIQVAALDADEDTGMMVMRVIIGQVLDVSSGSFGTWATLFDPRVEGLQQAFTVNVDHPEVKIAHIRRMN